MRIDFDEPIDRSGSRSLKWDRYQDKSILPLWLADMDFRSPPEVIDAVRECVEHGVFGYGNAPPALLEVVGAHLASWNDWPVAPEAISWISSTVPGLNVAAHVVGKPGDAIITPVPVYHPFLSIPGNAQRIHVPVRCARTGARWELDFDAIEAALKRTKANLIMFCNPHNPLGRVYNREELETLAHLALRYDAIICSDEIHCHLILDPKAKHIPIASLDPEVSRNTVTLMAPSKTFNIAGLNFGFAVITDKGLREKFTEGYNKFAQPMISPLALAAAEAAYLHGWGWLEQLLDYLRGNEEMLRTALAKMPGVEVTPVEATCLAWVDISRLNLSNPSQHFERYGLGLSDGALFDGVGFMRINFGCTRATLRQVIERFAKAVTGATNLSAA